MSESDNDEKSLFWQKLEQEQEALKKNTPVSKPPNKPHKPHKKGKRKFSAIALFATVFLLFLIIIVLLIFSMSLGGAGNPVLQFFGQNENTVKDFLLQIVNGSFGFLSVILLILIAVTLFFGFSLPKNEVQKRSVSFVFSLVSLGLIFVTILSWLGMHRFVSALEISSTVGEREAGIILYIREKDGLRKISPQETETMNVPLILGFSAEQFEKFFADKGIKSYVWDFTGNNVYDTSTQNTLLERRIQRYGNHEVGLQVLFDDGTTATSHISFSIPEGSFDAYPETGPIPLKVTFDASEISKPYKGSIASFEWDFNNDFVYEDTSRSPTISHTFEKIGTYTIGLRIVNQDQTLQTFSREITTTSTEEDSITPLITTYPEMPNPSLKRLEIKAGDTVVFNASNSWSLDGKIISYRWRSSDNTIIKKGPTMERKFLDEGEVEISLTLRDESGNTSEEKFYVVVLPSPKPPVVLIATDPEADSEHGISGTVPFQVLFDASGSTDEDDDIVAYEWDFDGDGEVDDSGEKVTHTFNIVGKYNVLVSVRDEKGLQSTQEIPVEVKNTDLTAVIYANPESAFVPCTVDFDGSLSSCADCEIMGYEWDFGDGNVTGITTAKVTHPYQQIGKFTASLTVHSKDNTDQVSKNIFCLEVPVDACFTSSKLRGRAPLKASFNPDCTTGTIESWVWDFGDGTSSDERIPTHLYKKNGEYTVTLTVTDANKNIDTDTLVISVE